jgi:hypothetical protein
MRKERRQPTRREWRLITSRRPVLRRIRRSQPQKKAEAKLPLLGRGSPAQVRTVRTHKLVKAKLKES